MAETKNTTTVDLYLLIVRHLRLTWNTRARDLYKYVRHESMGPVQFARLDTTALTLAVRMF